MSRRSQIKACCCVSQGPVKCVRVYHQWFSQIDNMDARLPFDEAVAYFVEFLDGQGWSRSLLWLSRERLTGHRCEYWVYRPEELQSAAAVRRWYEEARKDDWNLRIDGFAQSDGFTLAIVERGPGKSRMLNFGVITGEVRLHVVRSKVLWSLRRAICRIRGESAMLRNTDMPSGADPTTEFVH